MSAAIKDLRQDQKKMPRHSELDVGAHTVALHKDSSEYLESEAAMRDLRIFLDLVNNKK